MYLRNTGVKGPPRGGVARSSGRGGTESDSDTARLTGMGVTSAKSALMAKVHGPAQTLFPSPDPLIVIFSETILSVMMS